MKRRLIVACGSGVATSQTIASKVADLFEEDEIDFSVDAVDYKTIQNELPSAGIYLYIAQPDDEVLEKAAACGVRVFPGIPFLTGIGAEELYARLKELAQSSTVK